MPRSGGTRTCLHRALISTGCAACPGLRTVAQVPPPPPPQSAPPRPQSRTAGFHASRQDSEPCVPRTCVASPRLRSVAHSFGLPFSAPWAPLCPGSGAFSLSLRAPSPPFGRRRAFLRSAAIPGLRSTGFALVLPARTHEFRRLPVQNTSEPPRSPSDVAGNTSTTPTPRSFFSTSALSPQDPPLFGRHRQLFSRDQTPEGCTASPLGPAPLRPPRPRSGVC